ncbi:MAG: cysteine synthase A [Candidatus Melainabacteria bacterium HGW-Melainabacteria-1]|nr:MAG: cysteine synthase A [Candidatus Melainabacteria bacterium HGW-Melainabacteria-1]
MKPAIAESLVELIGNTPLLKIPSLSALSGCEIYLKCEQLNPGGSIKDRAALGMVLEALQTGQLRPGMTIVEGTAGNTGIGLAIVAKAFGLKLKVVMPRGQAPEKERMISLHGAELILVDPVPFKNENHFYHTARRLAEAHPESHWWANQFENLANARMHYQSTGPEIFFQMGGKIDYLVSVAGTGGTIGGNSRYLKERLPEMQVVLADPKGSGLAHYVQHGEFKSEGSSLTEGIGIMRLVANFAHARVDQAISLPDQDLLCIAHYVRDLDGIVLGSSSALNAATALKVALQAGKGKRLVSFACDLGERSGSKLYQPDYLASQNLNPDMPIDTVLESWNQRALV